MLLDELDDYDESIPAEYPILDKVYDWEYESWISEIPISLSADYMRRNEELEDLVLSLEKENEALKTNIDAERAQHDSDILKLKQKMEKEKISSTRKLEDKISKLEKKIEKYKLLADNLYLLEDLNKLRKESQRLRNEMFQMREEIKNSKKELNTIKKEIQNSKR